MTILPYSWFLISIVVLFLYRSTEPAWITEDFHQFCVRYTANDADKKQNYKQYVKNGIVSVETFFGKSFSKKFDVYIYPSRALLDSVWGNDWKVDKFKSDCWMVASGVGNKLDILSPKVWSLQACEHNEGDTIAVQRLITHELAHVYHGQINKSQDFSDTQGIDWFIEGLATFVSGQCDSIRINAVKKALAHNQHPKNLDDFWKGNLRYGFSGTIVMMIDARYGRAKLQSLLSIQTKAEILTTLTITEQTFIKQWQQYVEQL